MIDPLVELKKTLQFFSFALSLSLSSCCAQDCADSASVTAILLMRFSLFITY